MSRKAKRNDVCCKRYKSEHRQEKNKAKKLARHQLKHPSDLQASGKPVNYARKSRPDVFEKLFINQRDR